MRQTIRTGGFVLLAAVLLAAHAALLHAAVITPMISAGDTHSLALNASGVLEAAGSNSSGELGNGSLVANLGFTAVGTAHDWAALAARSGLKYSLALKTDGTLWSWGTSDHFQLGVGLLPLYSPVPVQVGTDANWAGVAAGTYHALGVKTDGTLWAWGDNYHWQLGTGVMGSKIVPTKVGEAANWATVSAAGYNSAAIRQDGTLWTWGDNSYGQCGYGSTYQSWVPKQVGSDGDWSSVSVGTTHMLSIRTNGTLWAWGRNIFGQVGDTQNPMAPEQIGADADWAIVSAGNTHSAAVKSDGSLWLWGQYPDANGYLTTTTVPTRVGTDEDWVAISAGILRTLALKSNGELWSWQGVTNGSRLLNLMAPSLVFPPADSAGPLGWFPGEATVGVEAVSAGPGEATVEYSSDGSTWASYTGPLSFSAEGASSLWARATDPGGLTKTSATQVLIDRTPPSVTPYVSLGDLGPLGWYRGYVHLTLGASDAESGIFERQFIGVPWVLGNGRETNTLYWYTAGETTFNAEATNGAGLQTIVPITVKVDRTTPVVSIGVSGTQGENGFYVSPVTFSVTATDAESGIYSIQYTFSNAYDQYYVSPVTVSGTGTFTFWALATDGAGHTAPSNTVVNIDTTSPWVTASNPPPNLRSVPVPSAITVTFSENVFAGPAFGKIALTRGKKTVAATKVISGNTLTVTPAALLAKGTSYTLTVPAGGAKDIAGLASLPYSLSFKTAR